MVKHYRYEKENSKFYNACSDMHSISKRLCRRPPGATTASGTAACAACPNTLIKKAFNF
jgi:hypothetical protein